MAKQFIAQVRKPNSTSLAFMSDVAAEGQGRTPATAIKAALAAYAKDEPADYALHIATGALTIVCAEVSA